MTQIWHDLHRFFGALCGKIIQEFKNLKIQFRIFECIISTHYYYCFYKKVSEIMTVCLFSFLPFYLFSFFPFRALPYHQLPRHAVLLYRSNYEVSSFWQVCYAERAIVKMLLRKNRPAAHVVNRNLVRLILICCNINVGTCRIGRKVKWWNIRFWLVNRNPYWYSIWRR